MSSYGFLAIKSLLKKEFIEHKVAFLYVPGILLSLLFLALFTAIWRNGGNFEMMGEFGAPEEGVDLFSVLYVMSIAIWLGYLTLMLFFYFAGSFHADRKNNSLLFWKSLPVSDLEIMATKTLAGLTVFPALIMFWAFLGAVFGYIVLNSVGGISPLVAALNSGTTLWTFINIQVSAMVFIFFSLLWYLPLFTFFGLLGALLKNWAGLAFILIIAMVSALESILSFSASGVFAQMLEDRLSKPFEIIKNITESQAYVMPSNIFDTISIANFVPGFLSQIDWAQMAIGWGLSALFIYLASEYRRRRLDA